MAADVTIPRLGWAMEEGVFAGWLKQPGDTVVPGEPLFLLEGEKATQEVEAVDGGVLHLAPDAPRGGETVLVGRVIASLCAAGEAPTWGAKPPAREPVCPAEPERQPPACVPRATPEPVQPPQEIPRAASPSVRRLARQLGIDLTRVEAGLPGGRLSVADLARSVAARPHDGIRTETGSPPRWEKVRSSPRARRVARSRGVDITLVRGTGAGGRVRERDVLAVSFTTEHAATTGADTTRLPITSTRRTIARHLVRSRHETVPVTLTAWADATALLAARAAGKAAAGPEAATLNDMLLVLLAGTLLDHPLLAARWEETHVVLPGPHIDIGLAVDTPGGLVVPVVRNVSTVTLAEVARQTRSLVERARTGRLSAGDMQGAVFTLTSLGPYGVEFFTPVINHPEAAILGVGAVRMQHVPSTDGAAGFSLRPHLPLSLSFDHRIVDGAPAARFLSDLVGRIAAEPAEIAVPGGRVDDRRDIRAAHPEPGSSV